LAALGKALPGARAKRRSVAFPKKPRRLPGLLLDPMGQFISAF
jgi:hypothetical protein